MLFKKSAFFILIIGMIFCLKADPVAAQKTVEKETKLDPM